MTNHMFVNRMSRNRGNWYILCRGKFLYLGKKDHIYSIVSLFQGTKYLCTNMVFGDSNSVLFIKVSLFQGVLFRGSHCT